MIEVKVNNQNHAIPSNTNLVELIDHLKMQPKGIAVAIAANVVPKTLWEETLLKGGEEILIIKATQGG